MSEYEYEKQAEEFLRKANATMEFHFAGYVVPPLWGEKEKPHASYRVTITTPRGSYTLDFYDSLAHTEILQMTKEGYAKKKFGRRFDGCAYSEQCTVQRELKQKKAKAKPTCYDVLACLTHYDPGSFQNFCDEFGYSNDSIRALKTYLAVQDEWENLRRIFTPEQLEELEEIN